MINQNKANQNDLEFQKRFSELAARGQEGREGLKEIIASHSSTPSMERQRIFDQSSKMSGNTIQATRKPRHGKDLEDEIQKTITALNSAGLKHNPKIGIGYQLGDTGQMISLHLNTPTPRQDTNDA